MSFKKNRLILIVILAIAFGVFLLVRNYQEKGPRQEDEKIITGQAGVIPDPVPEPIEQVDCLTGAFRYEAKKGETVNFNVRLAEESASAARLGPLPRGVNGALTTIAPGQARVNLNVSPEAAAADYSLVIVVEPKTADKAERLCQFNLVIN